MHPLKVFFGGEGAGERLGLSASTYKVYNRSFQLQNPKSVLSQEPIKFDGLLTLPIYMGLPVKQHVFVR